MIRKLLVIAAAVAMPATAMAGVSAIGGSSIAGAAAKVYTTSACSLSGSVTFPAPGESVPGTVTNKTAEKSVAATTMGPLISGTGLGCGTAGITAKISAPTSECWATLPVYVSKYDYTGGTLNSGTPSACDIGDGAAAGDTGLNATDVKDAAKDQYYYDDAAGYVSTTPPTVEQDIVNSLGAKGLKAEDNGNKVVLNVGDTGADTVSSVAGGACGTAVGFELTGDTSVTGLTYEVLLCLTTDTGGTSGIFATDIIDEVAGIPEGTISAAAVGGNSALSFTYSG